MKKIIRFNSLIYSKNSIEEAVRAYADIANINIKKNDIYYLVNINQVFNPKIRPIINDEFANYVLGLTKKCF